jgi:hypothetical protein
LLVSGHTSRPFFENLAEPARSETVGIPALPGGCVISVISVMLARVEPIRIAL